MGHATEARVVVVEDDELMQDALTMVLEGRGFDVRPHRSGSSLERDLPQVHPDLVLLDLSLGDGPDGLTLARRLRSADPGLPIIMVSGSHLLHDRLEAFEAGVDDFLEKPFSMAELVARIGAVMRRSSDHTEQRVEVGDLVIDQLAHTVTRGGEPIELRHLEFLLLWTLCTHAGQVLTKRQLLEQVWGHTFADPNAVEVRVSQLRRRLEEHGPRMIHTVRNVGYVLRG